MKLNCIFIGLLALLPGQLNSFKIQLSAPEEDFRLSFITLGFGSNMFDMEPVFKVDRSKFIYTVEDVWIQPGQTKIGKDTLLVGDFRMSSIDSINNLINQLKDSVIYNVGNYMSGSAAYIEISNRQKKIKFDLHNASDSTADKIVEILNTYIPAKMNKLFITK